MAKQTKHVKFADNVDFRRDLPKPTTDGNLTCPSCKKRYVTPLLLPCLHSLCKECLDSERARLKNGKTMPRCPTCSEAVDLQSDLPVNFILNNLVNKAVLEGSNSTFLLRCDSCDTSEERAVMRCNDCYLFLCNFCATAHRRMNATKTHKISSVQELRKATTDSSLPRPCLCVTHPKSQILYLCQSCMVGVCRECVLSKHRDHQLLRTDQAYRQLKADIVALTYNAQHKQKQMTKAVSKLQSSIAKVEKHSSKVRSDIEEYFEALLVAVRQRMKSLLRDLKNKTDDKLHKLQEKKLKLELSMKVMQNCCAFTEDALLHGSEVELISVSHAILHKLTQLQEEEVTPLAMDNDQKNCTFTGNGDNLLEMINKTGYLDDTCPITSPSLCTLSVNALHVTVKEVSRFTVTSINERGFRQSKGGDAVTLQLVTSKTQSTADNAGFKYSVRDNNDGQYTIAFLVNKADHYLLQVNINGHAVKESPMTLKVTPKDWIGSGCIITGENCDGLSSPHSVLVDSNNNNIVIADSHHHSIKTLDSKGHLKRSIGSQGVRDEQFNFPYCIALNHTCSLLAISDSHNNRIQVIDNTSGKLRKSFGVYGTGDGMLNHPHGIAFDVNDSIYIVDSGNSRLQIFSPEGDLLGKLESRHFVRPWGVTVTRDNLIAVTDYNLHKVLIFDKGGTLKLQFGSRGGGDGELNNPAGIAVDDENQFIIADRSNHRVQIFQRDGIYVTKFGGKGTGDGLMRFPAGVAVDESGHLYVADTLNNRIQIFSLTAV